MNHLGTIQLESERLILRCFNVKDAKEVFETWTSRPEVVKYLSWPLHGSVEITKMTIKSWFIQYLQENYYHWAITLKKNKKVIGGISVVKIDDNARKAEIGYCIGNDYWHQGYTSEAMARVIKFLFEEVDCNRIEAYHDINNVNSGKVMIKCGLKYEGLLRQYAYNNQGIVDCALYAILKEDYKK